MIKKPKKTKSLGYWQKKSDKKLQEIGRIMFEEQGCLICGGEYSCLHHYVCKAHSTALRYDWDNLIPICAKCHQSHHTGKNSTIHAQIDLIKGEEWLETILSKKRNGIGIKANKDWYERIYKNLCLITPYKTV